MRAILFALLACLLGVSASLPPASAPAPLPSRAPTVVGGGSVRALEGEVSPSPSVDPNANKEQEDKANKAQDTADAVRAGGCAYPPFPASSTPTWPERGAALTLPPPPFSPPQDIAQIVAFLGMVMLIREANLYARVRGAAAACAPGARRHAASHTQPHPFPTLCPLSNARRRNRARAPPDLFGWFVWLAGPAVPAPVFIV